MRELKRHWAELSEEIINEYFELLKITFSNILPSKFINCAEMNTTNDSDKNKVFIKTGNKHSRKVWIVQKVLQPWYFLVIVAGSVNIIRCLQSLFQRRHFKYWLLSFLKTDFPISFSLSFSFSLFKGKSQKVVIINNLWQPLDIAVFCIVKMP